MAMLRSIYDNGITIYRRTLKRSGFLHAILYKLMTKAVIPILERIYGFYTRDDDPLFFRLELILGSYEKETLACVKQVVKPGMTVLDVGAHVGYYTRVFANLVGSEGRVFAFEPNPITGQILRKNVARLPNVTVVQAAVSDRAGTLELYDTQIESGGSSLVLDTAKRQRTLDNLKSKEIAPRLAQEMPTRQYTVSAITIDEYFRTRGERGTTHFIKMDIEGAEIAALNGMRQALEASPQLMLVMEFNPHTLTTFGIEPVTALQMLFEFGFSSITVLETGRCVRSASDVSSIFQDIKIDLGKINLFCTGETDA